MIWQGWNVSPRPDGGAEFVEMVVWMLVGGALIFVLWLSGMILIHGRRSKRRKG